MCGGAPHKNISNPVLHLPREKSYVKIKTAYGRELSSMTNTQIGTKALTETEIEGITEYAWDDTHVYEIGIESFPGHITNTCLIIDSEVTLFDTAVKKRCRSSKEGLRSSARISGKTYQLQISPA